MHKASFYRRLFINYIGIIIIYTIIAVLLFFLGLKSYYNKEADISKEHFLEQYVSEVDKSLMISTNVANQLLTQKEVRRFILFKDLDYHIITQIYKHIQYVVYPFDRVGLFVALGKRDSDMLISSVATDKETLFYKRMNFPFSSQEELYDKWESGFSNESFVLMTKSNYYTSSQNMVTIFERRRITGSDDLIVYMSFPSKNLFPEIKGDDALFVTWGDEILLERGNKELLRAASKSLFSNNGKVNLEKVNDSGYAIYERSSEKGVFKYYYISAEPSLALVAKEIIKNYGIYYLLLIILGTFLSVFVAKKTYEPVAKIVEKIRREHPEREEKDEFTLIQKTSEEISQKNIELRETILKNKAVLKLEFLKNLLYGLSDQDEVEENLVKYELSLYDMPLSIIVFELANHIEIQGKLGESGQSIHREIVEDYKELFSAFDNISLIEMDVKRIVLIMPKSEFDLNELSASVKSMLKTHEEIYRMQTVAVMSGDVVAWQNLGTVYSELISSLELTNILPKNKLLRSDYLSKINHRAYYYPLDVEQNLIYYVEKQKEEEMHLLIDHLLKQNFNYHSLSSNAMSMFIFSISGTIYRIMNRQNLSMDVVFPEGTILYLELKMIKTEEEFMDKIHSVFQELLDYLLESDNVSEEESIGERLIDYIHANYREDISLNDLASHFSLTTAYVSALFKKEHGSNFKDYLNSYKIKQVKELIKENPSMKNHDLAAAVGYNSVNTFLRLFKKYTGMTPGKYAKSVKSSK